MNATGCSRRSARRHSDCGRPSKRISVVHRVDAREQLDERGLARAVLAQQREDFSGTHVQRDLVDRLRAAEALAHGLELQQRRAHARTAPLVFSRMR